MKKFSLTFPAGWLKSLCALFCSIFLFAFSALAQNQPIDIHGKVTNTAGTPLEGVSVSVKHSAKGTITKGDGSFHINKVAGNAILVISLIGYAEKEVTVNNQNSFNITLAAKDTEMDEVMVIGYGTAKKSTLTGSVTKVKGETIVQQPIMNPVLALQGRVPGVNITTASGNLGANVNVSIRGTNTILASSNPLYIIDGVPMPASGINAATYGGAAGTQSPFINLNAADIESIEVLKDAEATGIYGSRGANGVILISTKKGKAGPTRFNVDVYRGYQQAVNKLDLLSTQEYVQMRKDAFAADGITPTIDNAYDILEWGDQRYTDMQKLIFGNTATITDAQANVQGGSERTQFMLGAGFRDENAVLMGKNNQKKGTARLNISHRSANNKFSANASVTYSTIKMASIGTSGFSYAWFAPNMPLTDERTGLPYFRGTASNTHSALRYTYSETDMNSYNVIVSSSFAYKILPTLEAKVDASYTRLDYRGIEKYKAGYYNPNENLDYNNHAVFGSDYQNTYNIEPQLNYNTKLGLGKLSVLAGSTFQQTVAGGDLVTARNFPSELLMDNLASAGLIASYSTTYNQYKFNSLFGRVGYDIDGKYIASVNYRRDGSSRFGPGKQFGDFGSAGIAWILSKEKFFTDRFKFISFAKLRTSYGLTGNDAIGNYQFMETYGATPNTYNYNSGLYANRLGNNFLGWETNKKFEVALELNFLNNRITTTSAFFNNNSSNQLVNYPVPTQTGWSSYVANIDANIRNRGFEFEVNSTNINTKDLTWRTSFNITFFRNKLIDFPNLVNSSYSNTYEIGKSINVYRRYEFAYIDTLTGIPVTVDRDKSGTYGVADYISYGDADPRYYGGLGNTISYKGFELDFFFQFTKRPYANGYINSSNASQPGIIYNIPKFLLEGIWTEPGDAATRPRLSTVNSGTFSAAYNRYRFSTAGIEDASYIRLKTVELAYRLPKRLTDPIRASAIRIYARAQNLFTLTKYKGYDPETPGTATPPMRVITLGFNIGF